jgi:hypothetical protein
MLEIESKNSGLRMYKVTKVRFLGIPVFIKKDLIKA